MRLNILSLTLALASSFLFCSCQKIDLGEEADVTNTETLSNFSVNAKITQDNPWTVNIPMVTSKAVTTDEPIYMYYIFNSEGVVVSNKGNYANTVNIANGYPAIFSSLTDAGTYNLYGLLNVSMTEYLSSTKISKITLDSLTTITEPRDICLGSQQFVVDANKVSYDVSVTVSHIMAKLALSIKNVPASITSVTVTLPKESNKFNFRGEFKDSVQSQELTVVKASTANSDGTYDWSILDQGSTEEIVYPCILKRMPIIIVAADDKKIYTFNTVSPLACTSGTRTSLSANWASVYNADAAMTVSPWTGEQQSGTFDIGSPKIE